MNKVFIIAEAGVNHNGSLRFAKKMVDVASAAGADAIKFQAFHAESLASKFAPKAGYQKLTTEKNESQLSMLKKLELSLEAHKELMRYCRKKKIIFLSSVFDLKSIEFLSALGLKIFKIPSGEITNLPYLRKLGSLKKRIIMSTGMATLKEISTALRVLIQNGTKREHIAILHCTTQYPAKFSDVNLSAMATISNKFGVKVGYSDHTFGIEIPVAAVARGASIIEKHFTLDKTMPGPDHQASLEPCELRKMVYAIRNVEQAIGDGVKRPSRAEARNIAAIRKSIVAARDIRKGERFNIINLTVKRPATGLSPMLWDAVIGQKSRRNFSKDEMICV